MALAHSQPLLCSKQKECSLFLLHDIARCLQPQAGCHMLCCPPSHPTRHPCLELLTVAVQIWNAAVQEGSSGPASRLHSALMAVLTHMVGRLGSLAIQDPHIQAVLYALLQKGLEGSPTEQEVLVEDALKLLNATLAASSTLEAPLQVI